MSSFCWLARFTFKCSHEAFPVQFASVSAKRRQQLDSFDFKFECISPEKLPSWNRFESFYMRLTLQGNGNQGVQLMQMTLIACSSGCCDSISTRITRLVVVLISPRRKLYCKLCAAHRAEKFNFDRLSEHNVYKARTLLSSRTLVFLPASQPHQLWIRIWSENNSGSRECAGRWRMEHEKVSEAFSAVNLRITVSRRSRLVTTVDNFRFYDDSTILARSWCPFPEWINITKDPTTVSSNGF